jgi:hypothetical protein
LGGKQSRTSFEVVLKFRIKPLELDQELEPIAAHVLNALHKPGTQGSIELLDEAARDSALEDGPNGDSVVSQLGAL